MEEQKRNMAAGSERGAIYLPIPGMVRKAPTRGAGRGLPASGVSRSVHWNALVQAGAGWPPPPWVARARTGVVTGALGSAIEGRRGSSVAREDGKSLD